MADIKLRDGSGVEQIYTGIDKLTVPASTSGSVDFAYTADADAIAANIMAGKTAYVNGTKITGTIQTYNGSIS